MSYQTAKRNYEADKLEVGSEVLRCSTCLTNTARENLSAYGAMCYGCFQAYCKAAPRYEIKKDYPNDPLAWARRIIDKQKSGLPVSIFAAKMARDALGIKHE
jgi:hypothetical protein